MAQALFYSSNAVAMTLAAGIASGDTTCNLSSTSGLPASFPFKLLIGWSTAQQEVVHCTALSGVVATITRGQDGTTAQAHSIGATVVHGVSAREFNDLELHVGSTAAVHGITGSVVGTSDAQALTNKTFDATSTVSGAPIVGTTTVQTLTGKTLSPSINTGPGVIVQGLASQSGNLQEWRNSSGTPLTTIDSTGDLFTNSLLLLGGGDAGATVNVFPSAGTRRGIIVRAAASQSVSLQEWQNNGGTPLASVDNLGNVFATNLTNAWTAYTPTFTNCTGAAGNFAYLLVGKTLHIRGAFTAGTATATAAIRFSLPAALTVPAVPVPLAGLNTAATITWSVGSFDTTTITTASTTITAGASLVNLSVAGVIQVN